MSLTKDQVKVGGVYIVKLRSGGITQVRVEEVIKPNYLYVTRFRHTTKWRCTNLATGRVITIHSAQKFRREVTPND